MGRVSGVPMLLHNEYVFIAGQTAHAPFAPKWLVLKLRDMRIKVFDFNDYLQMI